MGNIKLRAGYNGYEVEWVDFNRTFRILQHDTEVKQGVRSITDCQKWIDDRLKQKFNRVDVIYMGWRGELKRGVATSIIRDGESMYVWFSGKNKHRSKENADSIYIDNPSNNKLLEIMRMKAGDMNTLKGEIDTLKSKLEHLTEEMMVSKEEKDEHRSRSKE